MGDGLWVGIGGQAGVRAALATHTPGRAVAGETRAGSVGTVPLLQPPAAAPARVC